MTSSASPQSMNRNEYLMQVSTGFDTIEDLWNTTDNVQEIHGLDSKTTENVKGKVETAYASLREARSILQDGPTN